LSTWDTQNGPTPEEMKPDDTMTRTPLSEMSEVDTSVTQFAISELTEGEKWPGPLTFEITQDKTVLDLFSLRIVREGSDIPVLVAQINAAALREGPMTRDLPEEDMAARQAIASQVLHEICELVMKNATLGLVYTAKERAI